MGLIPYHCIAPAGPCRRAGRKQTPPAQDGAEHKGLRDDLLGGKVELLADMPQDNALGLDAGLGHDFRFLSVFCFISNNWATDKHDLEDTVSPRRMWKRTLCLRFAVYFPYSIRIRYSFRSAFSLAICSGVHFMKPSPDLKPSLPSSSICLSRGEGSWESSRSLRM